MHLGIHFKEAVKTHSLDKRSQIDAQAQIAAPILEMSLLIFVIYKIWAINFVYQLFGIIEMHCIHNPRLDPRQLRFHISTGTTCARLIIHATT